MASSTRRKKNLSSWYSFCCSKLEPEGRNSVSPMKCRKLKELGDAEEEAPNAQASVTHHSTRRKGTPVHDHRSDVVSLFSRMNQALIISRHGYGPRTPASMWKMCTMILAEHPQNQHPGTHICMSARHLGAALWEVQRSSHGLKSGACAQLSSQCGGCSHNSKTIRIPLQEMPPEQHKIGIGDVIIGVPDVLEVPSHFTSGKEQCTIGTDDLRAELVRMRFQLHKCIHKEKSHQKQIERLVQERVFWDQCRKEDMRLIVRAFQDELNVEKTARSRLEKSNRKAVMELRRVESKLEKALLQLNREKKVHELMEDVCDELASEMGKHKARVEELEQESAKLKLEMEEKRQMLRVGDIWREQRVQMRLVEENAECERLNGETEGLKNNGRDVDLSRSRLTHNLPVLGENLSVSFRSGNYKGMSRTDGGESDKCDEYQQLSQHGREDSQSFEGSFGSLPTSSNFIYGNHHIEPAFNRTPYSVHQGSDTRPSPVHIWNHHWSAPDVEKLCHARGGDMLVTRRDNSLKAMLLEARQEGQQAQSEAIGIRRTM